MMVTGDKRNVNGELVVGIRNQELGNGHWLFRIGKQDRYCRNAKSVLQLQALSPQNSNFLSEVSIHHFFIF